MAANDKKLTGNEVVGDPKLDAKKKSSDLAADYNWSMALLNSDPDLRRLFRSAVTNGWSEARFVAEMQDTDWFRKHSDSYRQNEIARITNPATWKQARKQAEAQFSNMAASTGSQLSDKAMKKLVDSTMAFGWNEAQQQDFLAKYVSQERDGEFKGQYTGDAGNNSLNILKTSSANGYKIPKGSMDKWLREIAAGDNTVSQVQEHIRRQTAKVYTGFADELFAGADLNELASPYTRSMSQLLELNENDIPMTDKTIMKAMSYKDAKGKAIAMPLHEFEDNLRQDSRWLRTDNAHQQVMGSANNLLRSFGLIG